MALVLCTGSDPVVMKTRQLLLEHAGHMVTVASNDSQVEKACKSHQFDVAIIDQNVSPAVKQRFFLLLRKHCATTRILELLRPFNDRALEKADASLVMPSEAPEQLVELVTALAQREPTPAPTDEQLAE
jgi:DNA-binding response OmpR family regulator